MHISVHEYVMWLKERDYIRVQQKMELGEKWNYKCEETLFTFWHILVCTQAGLKFDSQYVSALCLHHQDRNSENCPVCIIIAVAEWLYLVYVRVCMAVGICARMCLYSCGRWGGCSGLWKTGGLTRMYGCFKIHLQAFFYRHSLLLSPQSAPYPTSTHTRTLQQQPSFCHYVYYYSILPELTNQRRAWNPEWLCPEPRLSPCNGGKTFISPLSCSGSIFYFLQHYLDPLWLHILRCKKGLIVISLRFTAD